MLLKLVLSLMRLSEMGGGIQYSYSQFVVFEAGFGDDALRVCEQVSIPS